LPFGPRVDTVVKLTLQTKKSCGVKVSGLLSPRRSNDSIFAGL